MPDLKSPPKLSSAVQQLREKLRTLEPGSERADVLNLIAAELKYSEPLRAQDAAKESYAISTALGYTRGAAYSLINSGYAEWRLGLFGSALTKSLDALSHFEQTADKYGEADALNTIGLISNSLGDGEKAMHYYEQSLKIREATGDRQGMAVCLNNIGEFHLSNGDYAGALECYTQSLKLKEGDGGWGRARALSGLGLVYLKMGDAANSLRFYTDALRLREEIGDVAGQAASLNSLATVYQHGHDLAAAEEHYLQSLKVCEGEDLRTEYVEALLGLGMLFTESHKTQRALQYLHQALAVPKSAAGTEENVKELTAYVHGALADAYRQAGDYASALEHFERYHTLEKEFFNDESARKTRLLQLRYEAERLARETEQRRTETNLLKTKNEELAEALRETERQRAEAEWQQAEAERQQAEAERQHREAERMRGLSESASQLKTELLNIAAHDLKNPLQSILGFADLLRETIEQEETQNLPLKAMAGSIFTSSRRMLSLIDGLLEAATVESDRFEIHPMPMDFAALVRTLVSSMEPLAERKQQSIILTAPESLMLTADAKWLMDAAENLLSNAIKYSPPGKRIWVDVLRNATQAELRVRDEGPGLGEDDLKKAFGKFQRLSARPTGGESSTGLGLSIVKRLVELHGGKAWAESDGKEKGATFVLTLPV
ncbi:MAG: tetratricopeptide repeat protein [Rhizobacter sp.]|nr:tetratricopeptide repeat protein [Chlorobiales bacterium]